MERALAPPDSEHGTGKSITKPAAAAPGTSSLLQLGAMTGASDLPVDRYLY